MHKTLDASDRFLTQTHQHSHPANPKDNDFMKGRARKKKRSAKDTAEKTQNITTAGLQEDVLARLPNIETILKGVLEGIGPIIIQ